MLGLFQGLWYSEQEAWKPVLVPLHTRVPDTYPKLLSFSSCVISFFSHLEVLADRASDRGGWPFAPMPCKRSRPAC
jgi:hypothetical protein